jgi:group I intron endonuclease
MRSGLIYLIINTINGKRYIGQTVKTLRQRWQQHKAHAKQGADTLLGKAIRKYGPESFTIEVVAESYAPFLDDAEKLAIWVYQSHVRRGGYNLTHGGDGTPAGPDNPNYGKPRSEEIRKKISESNTGRTVSAETRKRISDAKQGWAPSEQHRKRVSTAIQGNVFALGLKKLNASSKYYGVSFKSSRPSNKKWRCSFKAGKRIEVGYYYAEIEAAHAHDAYVIEHGLERPLNFPVSVLQAA